MIKDVEIKSVEKLGTTESVVVPNEDAPVLEFLSRYKWWILGGIGAIAVVVIIMKRRSAPQNGYPESRPWARGYPQEPELDPKNRPRQSEGLIEDEEDCGTPRAQGAQVPGTSSMSRRAERAIRRPEENEEREVRNPRSMEEQKQRVEKEKPYQLHSTA